MGGICCGRPGCSGKSKRRDVLVHRAQVLRAPTLWAARPGHAVLGRHVDSWGLSRSPEKQLPSCGAQRAPAGNIKSIDCRAGLDSFDILVGGSWWTQHPERVVAATLPAQCSPPPSTVASSARRADLPEKGLFPALAEQGPRSEAQVEPCPLGVVSP